MKLFEQAINCYAHTHTHIAMYKDGRWRERKREKKRNNIGAILKEIT